MPPPPSPAAKRTQLVFLRLLPLFALALTSTAAITVGPWWPEPGEVFIERATRPAGDDWRVTDDLAGMHHATARKFLPNPTLQLDRPEIPHGGVPDRSSLLVDFWNGHPGTVDKGISINGGPWLPLDPQLAGALPGESLKHTAQFNLEVEVPSPNGENEPLRVEGRCGPNGFKWGQWGWYGFLLRTTLDPRHTPPHPATLCLPGGKSFADNPIVELSIPEGAEEVSEVRIFARYNGPDENGDGVTTDWHGWFKETTWRGHVATLTSSPWRTHWNTEWLPDQPDGSIALVAHVRDSRGVWTVTPVIEGLSLVRSNHRISMHTTYRQRPFLWVRDGQLKSVVVPTGTLDNPSEASEARLHIRGWNLKNGEHGHTPLRINTGPWLDSIRGLDHFASEDLYAIDPRHLQIGDNLLSFYSRTRHHGAEILWPGPALLLKLGKQPQTTSLPSWEVLSSTVGEYREAFLVQTEHLGRQHFEYSAGGICWLYDARGGGFSAIIDPDGRDWVGFKPQPLGEFPGSAAAGFRGLGNLVFRGDDDGVGHPGFDKCESVIEAPNRIRTRSLSGEWEWQWTLGDGEARFDMLKAPTTRRWWFLYEGTPAGKFDPVHSLWGTVPGVARPELPGIGTQLREENTAVWIGHRDSRWRLSLRGTGAAPIPFNFWWMGSEARGDWRKSGDGMLVVGFGRGSADIGPTLEGLHSFSVRLSQE